MVNTLGNLSIFDDPFENVIFFHVRTLLQNVLMPGTTNNFSSESNLSTSPNFPSVQYLQKLKDSAGTLFQAPIVIYLYLLLMLHYVSQQVIERELCWLLYKAKYKLENFN